MNIIEFKGSYLDIGTQHGSQKKAEIHRCLDFYRTLRNLPIKTIEEKVGPYKTYIQKHFPNIHQELSGVATGSAVDLNLIYALNYRSELIDIDIINTSSANLNECTTLYDRNTAQLAENWDYYSVLEDLFFICKVTTPSGNSLIQVTEPGIVGKIGLNSHGIGVCLNFLDGKKRGVGLSIHLMMRQILEMTSFDQIIPFVLEHGGGKTGSLTVADDSGNFVCFEFLNGKTYLLYDDSGVFIRTNHYLSPQALSDNSYLFELYKNSIYQSSIQRYSVGRKAIGLGSINHDKIKQILCDNSCETYPIARPYISIGNNLELGTCCSILMDLKAKQLSISKGCPSSDSIYTIYSLA